MMKQQQQQQPAAASSGGGSTVTVAVAGAGCEEEKKAPAINSELWHACAGPLVSLPPAGSLVVYFPQGHSEQVAASMQKDVDAHVPNYPNLPSKLICLLHNITLHADLETDEVYAQMTLQPVTSYGKEALQLSELALKLARPQNEFFCKTLTASDTSTHGGFSVPRRSAEKIFPPLDFSMQPPAQEIQARDLHDNVWTFRHIYRGQPKRHLLTTGWSLFVSGKKLFAGDSVIFVRDERQQLLLGIRRANRQPTNISSSVLSSDSMHIGILAAAAHAAANNSPFTIFYNPRASPTEFVIPFAKYQKAVYSNQLSLGMRFRMMFETEELGTRRYMGTITGINDLDPVRWKNSQWRNLQVGWDESAAGERRNRVSVWEIEPVAAPFFICPPPFFGAKRPRQLDDESSEMENLLKRAMPWLGEEVCIKDPQTQNTVMPGLSLVQWMNMNMQQSSSFANTAMQSEYLRSITNPSMQNIGSADLSRQLCLQNQLLQQNNMQFNTPKLPQQMQPNNDFSKAALPLNQLGGSTKSQEQTQDASNLQRQQQSMNFALPLSQAQTSFAQVQVLVQNQMQQQPHISQNQLPAVSQPLLSLSLSQPGVTLAQLPLIQEQQKLIMDITKFNPGEPIFRSKSIITSGPSSGHVEASGSTHSNTYLLATEPTAIPFHELRRMTDGFSEERLLGTGGYGMVYKGVLENGEVIAVKKLHNYPELAEKSFRNELLNLWMVKHKNIIRLVGYCSEKREKIAEYNGEIVIAVENERALCLEYMKGGTLEELLSDESCGLDWEARYEIIKGICQGLKHLHGGSKNPIYHLDLKPSNILLDEHQIPKIGDFGLSRLLGSMKTRVTQTVLGTRGYMPPEYINEQKISGKFDIYSLGVIIIEVIAGRDNYYKSADMPSQKFIELVTQNWRKRVQAETMSTEALLEVQKCIKIALRCVEANRENRPTITEIVEELNMIDRLRADAR